MKTTHTIAIAGIGDLDETIAGLQELRDALPRSNGTIPVYVRDVDGRDLQQAILVRERLTDGSFVFNVIVGP